MGSLLLVEGVSLLSVDFSLDEAAPEVEVKGSLLVIGSGILGGSAGLSWVISALLKKASWALVLLSEPGPSRSGAKELERYSKGGVKDFYYLKLVHRDPDFDHRLLRRNQKCYLFE